MGCCCWGVFRALSWRYIIVDVEEVHYVMSGPPKSSGGARLTWRDVTADSASTRESVFPGVTPVPTWFSLVGARAPRPCKQLILQSFHCSIRAIDYHFFSVFITGNVVKLCLLLWSMRSLLKFPYYPGLFVMIAGIFSLLLTDFIPSAFTRCSRHNKTPMRR